MFCLRTLNAHIKSTSSVVSVVMNNHPLEAFFFTLQECKWVFAPSAIIIRWKLWSRGHILAVCAALKAKCGRTLYDGKKMMDTQRQNYSRRIYNTTELQWEFKEKWIPYKRRRAVRCCLSLRTLLPEYKLRRKLRLQSYSGFI